MFIPTSIGEIKLTDFVPFNRVFLSKYYSSDPSKNWDTLCELMSVFKSIVVDVDFTVNAHYNYLIEKDLKFEGDKTLIFTSSNDLRCIMSINQDDISVDFNVDINLNCSSILLGGNGSDYKLNKNIDRVSFCDLDISGKGIPVGLNIESGDATVYKIKEIVLKNISGNNINNGATDGYLEQLGRGVGSGVYASAMFNIQHISFDTLVIDNVDLLEFGKTFIRTQNRNSSASRKNIICTFNKMVNDTTWGDHSVHYDYYCFGVLEADNIHYFGNHVEGLKCKTTTAGNYGAVIYDVYLKCNKLVYDNNLFKNNFAFYEIDTENPDGRGFHLMKCKAGLDVEFKNSKFIIEQTWLEANTANTNIRDRHSIVIDCDALTTRENNEIWKVDNVTIDVYNLKFEDETCNAPDYAFTNNKIKANTMWGCVFQLATSNTYINDRVMEDNVFLAKNNDSVNPFRMFHQNYGASDRQDTIMSIQRNKFLVPNFYKYDSGTWTSQNDYQSRWLKSEHLIVKDNLMQNKPLITNIDSNIVWKNNQILENIDSIFAIGATFYYNGYMDIEQDFLVDTLQQNMGMSFSPVVASDMILDVDITSYLEGTIENFHKKVTLNPTGTYIDTTQLDPVADNNITVNDGNLESYIIHTTYDILRFRYTLLGVHRFKLSMKSR